MHKLVLLSTSLHIVHVAYGFLNYMISAKTLQRPIVLADFMIYYCKTHYAKTYVRFDKPL